MKYTEANFGRIFVLRLEDGDRIPDIIKSFATKLNIKSALVHFLGGSSEKSRAVVGPDKINNKPRPMIEKLSGISESVGFGTLFSNEQDIPKLHMHSSFGRGRETITGCTREGVEIWYIGEVVITELINLNAKRKIDTETGFELLEIE